MHVTQTVRRHTTIESCSICLAVIHRNTSCVFGISPSTLTPPVCLFPSAVTSDRCSLPLLLVVLLLPLHRYPRSLHHSLSDNMFSFLDLVWFRLGRIFACISTYFLTSPYVPIPHTSICTPPSVITNGILSHSWIGSTFSIRLFL